MQAVILAAGRGTRMKALTEAVPKPMLEVLGKTLLEHKFDVLPPEITEIILVVGYHEESVRGRFGDSYNGTLIRYVHQEELNGTGGAVYLAAPFLHDRFLVMMGDDIYGKADVARCIETPDWSVLVKKTDQMASGGSMVLDANECCIAILEGDHRGKPGIMNTNLFVLDTRLFAHPLIPAGNGHTEFGLPQTVVEAAKDAGIPLRAVDATLWIQITSPEDLSGAEGTLSKSAQGV